MNRKQKIIISVTGIFLVALILVGLTYAYFLTQITGNTNSKSISVTTANLELLYGDGTNKILTSNTKIRPSSEPIGTKDFTVTNMGDTEIESYSVILEDLNIFYASATDTVAAGTTTSLVYPDAMKMTLTCKVYKTSEYEANPNTAESTGNCTNQIIDGIFPDTNDILVSNSINIGETHKYILTLTYTDNGSDQSDDMNKTIEGKINIIDTKGTVDIEGTLVNYTTGDYVQVNSEPKTSQIIYDKENKVYKYKVVGLKPDNHKISIYNKSNTTTPKITQDIIIEKGDAASVNNNIVTITDKSRTLTIDVNGNNTFVINNNIEDIEENKDVYFTINNGELYNAPTNNTFGEFILSSYNTGSKFELNNLNRVVYDTYYSDCKDPNGNIATNSTIIEAGNYTCTKMVKFTFENYGNVELGQYMAPEGMNFTTFVNSVYNVNNELSLIDNGYDKKYVKHSKYTDCFSSVTNESAKEDSEILSGVYECGSIYREPEAE